MGIYALSFLAGYGAVEVVVDLFPGIGDFWQFLIGFTIFVAIALWTFSDIQLK